MSAAPQPPSGTPERPADVDTGFWIWLAAVPLLVIGQLADAYAAAEAAGNSNLFIVTAFIAAIIGSVVIGLLALLRAGNRWARSLLTTGGMITIFLTMVNLLTTARPPVPAIIYAVTGIFGAVFIAGGIYLLHRPDAQRYFVR